MLGTELDLGSGTEVMKALFPRLCVFSLAGFKGVFYILLNVPREQLSTAEGSIGKI